MQKNKNNLLLHILAPLGALLIYLVTISIRKKIINKEYGMHNGKMQKAIYTIWHNRLFLITGHFRYKNLSALISKSKDGEIIARIAKYLGHKCVRGSSSKGGAFGLLKMIKKTINDNSNFVITVDGPRGPIYEVKDGAIMLASKTGLPIIPFTYNVSKKIEINSWDKFIIPIPFSKAEIIFGKPILIDKDLDEKKIAFYKKKIKKELTKYSMS